jgi:hypothetical protein
MNWYYSVEGRSHGPVNQQDMLRLAKEGVLGTDTLIWHPGLEEWNPVWKLMPQAIEHMKKSSMAQQARGDTERVPVSEQDKVEKLSESMFRKLFARLRRT